MRSSLMWRRFIRSIGAVLPLLPLLATGCALNPRSSDTVPVPPPAHPTAESRPAKPGLPAASAVSATPAKGERHQATSSAGSNDISAREVLVTFSKKLPSTAIQQEVATMGAAVVRVVPRLNVYRLRLPDGQTVDAFVKAHAANPYLARLEANPLVHLMTAETPPNDPLWPNQWALGKMGVPEAWAVTTGRPDVIVALIDTGIDANHPDLAGSLVAG